MASKIDSLDFSRYKTAMIEREGYSQEVAEESWRDLLVLLNAMEAEPDKAFALTVSADRALHGLLLDTVGHFKFSTSVFGAGKIVVHDPYAYATPEFDAAWENTRTAFAKVGLDLPADYRNQPKARKDSQQAEVCLVSVREQAEVCLVSVREQAEVCLVSVREQAEVCLMSVREQAEVCLVSVKNLQDVAVAA